MKNFSSNEFNQLRNFVKEGKLKFFRSLLFSPESNPNDFHHEFFYFSIDEFHPIASLIAIHCFQSFEHTLGSTKCSFKKLREHSLLINEGEPVDLNFNQIKGVGTDACIDMIIDCEDAMNLLKEEGLL